MYVNKNNNTNHNNHGGARNDWRKKNSNHQNDLPKNLKVTVPVSCYGITMDGKEYDGTTFMDLMDDLQANDVFSKISIPVYTKASYITKDPKTRWNSVVGYMKKFNEDGDAECIIYSKSIDVFNGIEDAVIVPRVVIKQNKCVCIIGLDIVSKNDISK